MDCRKFKKKHLAFLDDTLPGVDAACMREHMQECTACARQDAAVRRSLLVLRNLPPVRPSVGFSDRLRTRLAAECLAQKQAAYRFRGPDVVTFVSLAGAVVATGVLSIWIARYSAPTREYTARLPAVIVAHSDGTTRAVDNNVAAPAYVVSMSTGMPMWPALLLAEEGSLRFATAELRPATPRMVPQP